MHKTLEQIKNYTQLHTAEMDDANYINLMRGLSEWAKGQADAYEFREENDIDMSYDE